MGAYSTLQGGGGTASVVAKKGVDARDKRAHDVERQAPPY
jgi:hypothetical protein